MYNNIKCWFICKYDVDTIQNEKVQFIACVANCINCITCSKCIKSLIMQLLIMENNINKNIVYSRRQFLRILF